MKYTVALSAAAFALLVSTQSFASPLLAGPVANAGASAIAGSASGAIAGGGDANQGQLQGQEQNGSITNESGDSRALGIGISQAPTAISGICGKGNKFAFGALEWTDFSSKCFNYMIAMEAAKRGEWDLANQWVIRADGM